MCRCLSNLPMTVFNSGLGDRDLFTGKHVSSIELPLEFRIACHSCHTLELTLSPHWPCAFVFILVQCCASWNRHNRTNKRPRSAAFIWVYFFKLLQIVWASHLKLTLEWLLAQSGTGSSSRRPQIISHFIIVGCEIVNILNCCRALTARCCCVCVVLWHYGIMAY